jgi:hypothetical protein
MAFYWWFSHRLKECHLQCHPLFTSKIQKMKKSEMPGPTMFFFFRNPKTNCGSGCPAPGPEEGRDQVGRLLTHRLTTATVLGFPEVLKFLGDRTRK